MFPPKAGGKTAKSQAKRTKHQTQSLLTTLKDESKVFKTENTIFQAQIIWIKVVDDLNKTFHPDVDSDQSKNLHSWWRMIDIVSEIVFFYQKVFVL